MSSDYEKYLEAKRKQRMVQEKSEADFQQAAYRETSESEEEAMER